MSDVTSVATNEESPAGDTSAVVAQDEASVQTSEAPNATQGNETAQEAESTEVSAAVTVEEKLFAGKYKSVDELEKAYKNAESKLGSVTSEKAELSRILTDAFGDVGPAQSGATVQPQQSDYSGFESDVTPQPPQDDGVKRDMAIMKFMWAHENADANAIKEVLTTDPIISQISGYEAKLEYALLRSQNMSHSKAIETAKKEASQATQTKIIEKQAAQVESASKTEQVDEKTELKNRMATGSYEDREKARREYIRKYLV